MPSPTRLPPLPRGAAGVAARSREAAVVRGRRGAPAGGRWAVVAAAVAALAAGGCLNHVSHASLPVFSPAGDRVQYVRVNRLVLGVPFTETDAGVILQSADVHWLAAGRPEAAQRLNLAWTGVAGERLEGRIHGVFSPDGRHLALVSPGQITLLDTSSGESWPVSRRPEELVTCLFWTSTDEVVYAAHTNRRGGIKQVSDRAFWRQRIRDATVGRAAVFSEKNAQAGAESGAWPLEQASPRGRYVVFMSPADEGRFRLLEVASGAVRTIGRTGGPWSRVSWKPDESAVLCAAATAVDKPCHAVLVDPATGQSEELGRPFTETFGWCPPLVEPLWTPDGQWLVVNDKARGGCLVRPVPWEVVPIGQRLRDHLGGSMAVGECEVRRLPTAGWVLARSPQGEAYAADYTGRTFLPLGDTEPWAWSPDGRRVAALGREGDVVVHPVNLTAGASVLPTPAPAGSPATPRRQEEPPGR